ncbi:MAG: ATP-binding cassette domain-containing protein [Candidatus Cloacimonetes bacterium]|nr:ATP-binding cassette domain-containing protein [Candidatus Cloacimonadota bacterium]MDY0171846.1 ATP-binding cassette domain-containing protein [Candidatus Cloacimonadaceae bacterium]
MLRTPTLMRENQERLKKTIDMVTRLYVYNLKGDDITASETDILYSLLTNLFAQVDVSWESYVKQIMESEFDIEEVLRFLDRHLSLFDKIRVLQSLVIMARTEADFAISELTEIMQFSKQLNISTEVFLPLVDHLEHNRSGLVTIPCRHHLSHLKHSVFSDYVVFGSGAGTDIAFRSERLSSYECAIFAIDKYLFLSIPSSSGALINSQAPERNSIILLSDDAMLSLGGRNYSHSCLENLYALRDESDVIAFRKSSYDFIVYKEHNSFNIVVTSGVVSLNGRELAHNRRHEVFFDDTMQIRGYAPFHLVMVIENRSSIGVDDYIPKRLYIYLEKGYFSISREDSENSIALIELRGQSYHVLPPKKGYSIYVNRKVVNEATPIVLNSDILTIEKRNYRINNFYDLIETPFEMQKLSVVDIKHFFRDGKLALDSVSFEVEKGQLVAILGQSGCGKSTLTNVLATEITPTYGQILIDGKPIHSNLNYFLEYLAYVPQQDMLYPNLSVYENLYYRLRLRMPKLQKSVIEQKVNNILFHVKLNHHHDTIVGETSVKNLSGGERKRLNIALELLFEPTIIICDEPTSGLSFNDAEQIIGILSKLCEQGKIVIITIHQPNSSIYRKFDRVMMMDMGGRVAFYGTPNESFAYFDEELQLLSNNKTEIETKRHLKTSDYFYDVITYPEYDAQGQPVYEQLQKQVQAKRMFPPEYWRDKFKRKMLFEMIQSDALETSVTIPSSKRRRKPMGLKSYVLSLLTFISRSFKMKFRGRTNQIITFIEAPLLALIIAFILRHTTSASYSYHDNNNVFIYVFVSLIAFIFLGMSNSIEEILGERRIVLRERLMNLKMSSYLLSKIITLCFFGLVQATLYQAIASLILGVKGLGFSSILYFFLASMVGNSIGLLCSAFIKENRVIINLLPLILIPQIIFGGAVIEFERMNRNLTLWQRHPIPEVVQAIPSRWLFEGLTTAYAKNTKFHRALRRIEKKELTYLHDYRNAAISQKEFQKRRAEVYYAKTAIAEKWDPNEIVNSYLNSAVSMMDGKVMNTGRNEFMSSYKIWGKRHCRTWNFNALVILLFAFVLNLITWIKLKVYFKE